MKIVTKMMYKTEHLQQKCCRQTTKCMLYSDQDERQRTLKKDMEVDYEEKEPDSPYGSVGTDGRGKQRAVVRQRHCVVLKT